MLEIEEIEIEEMENGNMQFVPSHTISSRRQFWREV